MPHSNSWTPILILFLHLYLGLFSSGFPTETLYVPLPNTWHMPPLSLSSWFDYPNNIGNKYKL
jgi:hypothetical protein